MSVSLSLDRPPIDPYPLSPYVTWAGNRNRDPILKVFIEIFPKSGNVLELASGSGNHINYFAPHFPQLRFQPSDYNSTCSRRSKRNALNRATPMLPIR